VNARIAIWLEATSQTKIWEEIFESLHYKTYSANRWKGDYLQKDRSTLVDNFSKIC